MGFVKAFFTSKLTATLDQEAHESSEEEDSKDFELRMHRIQASAIYDVINEK